MSEAVKDAGRRAVLRDALERIEALEAKLAAADRAGSEPIAVIGMGCRFPGGVDGPDAYWRLLRDGVDAVREVPRDRWDVARYYDPDPRTPGKTYTRWGGYLDQIDRFDASFFGIPPREAVTLDPQQRLFLEVVWEALENAGEAPLGLRGSQTGVFVGVTTTEYLQHLNKVVRLEDLDAYHASGNTLNATAGRVAYTLGLHGPSVSLDTACSSSLVAVHLACQSLRSGECSLALAGGVNVILMPETYVCFSKWGMMSPVGRCKTFDASADGFVRAEGCGVVVLRRLSEAVDRGDLILALIRGSAVNQDGPSSGLSVPNGLAQEQVVRTALENARVRPEQVGYVEAHGTGTTLGDPIEVEALGEVFGRGRPKDDPLAIGSVKTNLGHMESAAGVAGLIKVVLTLRHKEIPPHLHLQRLSPRIPWEALPFTVPSERTPWRAGKGPRIAGVSSFGFSGTNAHLVLEEAPEVRTEPTEPDRTHHLLSLSAKSGAALRDLAASYAVHLGTVTDASWPDTCHTANVGRSHFGHRLAVVASSPDEACRKLSALAAVEPPAGLSSGEVRGTKRVRVAFLFTGQGAQYPGMGRRLHETSPVFREEIDRCDTLLRPLCERSLLSVLYPAADTASSLNETASTQVALFALEYALAALWRSWGVEPSAVLGHSIGEYVAACLAGVFSLEDGLKLIAARGRLMEALPRDGAMAAIFADEERVAAAVAGCEDRVSIAAVNGPESVVISGRREAVDQIVEELGAGGIRSRRLNVSHAFHSPLMDPVLDDFERVASQVVYRPPRMPLISNVTGQVADAAMGSAGYWRRHVRETVRFAASMRTLHAAGPRVFLEVGPGTTLLGMARPCVSDPETVWLPSLRQGREDWEQILETLGTLYVHGVEPDWRGLDRPYARHRVALPTYPFQRQRFWVDAKPSAPAAPDPALTTGVTRLIHDGNTAELARVLRESATLSHEDPSLLSKVLDALVARHKDEIAALSSRDRLYEIEWREQPHAGGIDAGGPRDGGVWLLFADAGGIGRRLQELLLSRGQRCVGVRPGEGEGRDGDGTWRIDPGRPSGYPRLLQSVAEEHGLPVRRVIHLWGLDLVRSDGLTPESLTVAQRPGCQSVMHLARAVMEARPQVDAKLFAVTRGVVPAEQAPRLGALPQAPIWGLGRALALECPEVWGGLVDLPADATHGEEESLLRELWDRGPEDQVALRGARRYVPRLAPYVPDVTSGPHFRADGTYLITGGLGGLGLEVARWIVERGARHLVLVGRRTLGTAAPARESIGRLEALGASVLVAAADVAAPEDLGRLLAGMKVAMPPLRGILHAAGVGGQEAFNEIDPETFEAVLRPKLAGSWALWQATSDLPLDFFVCFSSIASVWGSKGQTHYAAANAFLDTFAHALRGIGRTALSVNWGPWAGGGMATEDFRSYMARLGVHAMPPEQATAALGYAMESNRAQLAVAHVDWHAFKAVFEARGRRPMLDGLQIQPAPEEPRETAPRPAFLRDLNEAAANQRKGLLIAHLQGEARAVMGFATSEAVEPDRGFFEMGMDSLMAVELRDRLQAGLQCALPATLAFDHPNIDDLAGHLLGPVLGLAPAAPDDASSSANNGDRDALLERIKSLSDDGLEALLEHELDTLDGR